MKILILTNSSEGAYMFRRELISSLLKKHEVILSVPRGLHFEDFGEMGCKMIDTPLSRDGKNLFEELSLYRKYSKIISSEKPDVVLTFTVKPNIYAANICRKKNIARIVTVTGLGSPFEKGGRTKTALLKAYVSALEKADHVFFQNASLRQFFENNSLKNKNVDLIPGSGVNTEHFCFQAFPEESENVVFLFAGRILKDKGIDEYLYCAERIKEKYPDAEFAVAGVFESKEYESALMQAHKKGTVNYLGFIDDMTDVYKRCWALINPSRHEGMSNVCLEASSSGRAVIASDIPGCRETVENGKTGFTFEVGNGDALVETVEKYISMPHSDKIKMGEEGRKKAEKVFDRRLVIEKYEEIIKKISRSSEI